MTARNSLRFFFIVFLMILTAAAFAEAGFYNILSADSHTAPITALVQTGSGEVISAGEDGFINIWNMEKKSAESRFQLSPYPITSMAHRPNHSQIAIIESDGLGLYRISAWDYDQNKKLFTLRFKDPVSFISYSKNGSFLIAARNGRTGFVFINPQNGDLLQAPSGLNGTAMFAATGKSERTMITYSPLGTISYWNLENGEQIQQVTVPQNIKSPFLFKNNLFFAGIDNDGCVVLDAVSGKEIGRDNSIKDGELFAVSEEGSEFICIQKQDSTIRYLRFRMENNGNLRSINQKEFPTSDFTITCSLFTENQIVLGTDDGKINLYEPRTNRVQEMQTDHQLVLNEIAASGSALAVLYDTGKIAFIPADFNMIFPDTTIRFEETGGCNNISTADVPYYKTDFFVLWKSNDASYKPVIRNETGIIGTVNGLSSRYPLRTISALNKLILFLDTGGNLSLYNIDTETIEYRHNAAGVLHANFINEKNIIIARSGTNGNTPFLMIDTSSGETVPIAYPADIAIRTFLGQRGMIYAAVINENDGESKTTIIDVNTSSPADSKHLVEYQGEDTSFSIALHNRNLATNLGGDGVTLFTQQDFKSFERSSGLPVTIVSSGSYFAVLDNSGSIIWHNASTGEREAELRMYRGKWYLQKKNGDILEGMIE